MPTGRHPGYGTHNALLALGPDTYFEVMAPDPTVAPPEQGVLFGLDRLREPRLLTWVLRAEDLEDTVDRAGDIGLGRVVHGHRQNPDGSVVRWRVTDPYAFPLAGAIPFLIAWGETPHPSASLPSAGELLGFRLEHPEADAVRVAWDRLGVSLPVTTASDSRFSARIRTVRGDVEL